MQLNRIAGNMLWVAENPDSTLSAHQPADLAALAKIGAKDQAILEQQHLIVSWVVMIEVRWQQTLS